MFGGKMWTTLPSRSIVFRHSCIESSQTRDDSSRNLIISFRFTLTPRSAMDNARIMARTLCSLPPHRVVVMARDAFAIVSWTDSGCLNTSISVLKRRSKSPYWSTSRIFFIVCLFSREHLVPPQGYGEKTSISYKKINLKGGVRKKHIFLSKREGYCLFAGE